MAGYCNDGSCIFLTLKALPASTHLERTGGSMSRGGECDRQEPEPQVWAMGSGEARRGERWRGLAPGRFEQGEV